MSSFDTFDLKVLLHRLTKLGVYLPTLFLVYISSAAIICQIIYVKHGNFVNIQCTPDISTCKGPKFLC